MTLPSPAVRPLDNLHRCYTVMIMSKDEREENNRRVAAKAAEAARALWGLEVVARAIR